MNSILIIAEAGVNHNGEYDMALQLIDEASAAGVDAVKFQTFVSENLLIRNTPKAEYQKELTNPAESQFDMLKKLELNHATHRSLKRYAEEKGLLFMSTAFDQDSLKFLSNDLGLNLLKIPSGELTNGPLLLEYGKTRCDLIMSTGMGTLEETRQALSVLAFGFTDGTNPCDKSFERAFESEQGNRALKEHVVLLHCTSEYPAPYEDINLLAMDTLRKEFGLRVGYSDHSIGILVSSVAAALGAVVIEKHFTLNRNLPGPDHRSSLEPDELKNMVENIRSVEQILGDGDKIPRGREIENRKVARKSLVAAQEIQPDQPFSAENVTVKRPADGRSPMDYWSLIGTNSRKCYQTDEFI